MAVAACRCSLTAVLVWLCAQAASATEPYTPTSADTVLLQRPAGAAKSLRDLRRATAANDPAARLAAVQVHHDTRFRFDPDHPDPGQIGRAHV